MSQRGHERLSDALCEAVGFGTPTQIKLGLEDRDALLASLSPESFHKIEVASERFEGVPLVVEGGRSGCVVEHDGRYMQSLPESPPKAIPQSAAFDRRTQKPIIVAW